MTKCFPNTCHEHAANNTSVQLTAAREVGITCPVAIDIMYDPDIVILQFWPVAKRFDGFFTCTAGSAILNAISSIVCNAGTIHAYDSISRASFWCPGGQAKIYFTIRALSVAIVKAFICSGYGCLDLGVGDIASCSNRFAQVNDMHHDGDSILRRQDAPIFCSDV